MLLSFQFPFLDIRSFIDTTTYKLKCCDNIKNPIFCNKEFIRSFGSIKERYNANQTAERFYCTANKAVIFNQKNSFIYGINRRFNTQYVFKRFFSNGANCRLDLGIKNVLHSRYSYDYLQEIVLKLLSSNAKIKKSNIKFYRIGKALSELYLHSTTQDPKKNLSKVSKDWVGYGNPMLLIEVDDRHLGNLPSSFQMVETKELKEWGVSLYFTIINDASKNINLSTWILCKSQNSSKDKIRNLRIYLMKMHQERECFYKLISELQSGDVLYPSSEKVNLAIENYVTRYYQNFCREKHYGVSNNIVLSTVNKIDSIVNTYQRKQLLDLCIGTKLYSIISDMLKEDIMEDESKKTTFTFNGPVFNSVFGGTGSTINVNERPQNNDNDVLLLKIAKLEKLINSSETQSEQLRELSDCIREISSQVSSGNKPIDKKGVLAKLRDGLINIPNVGMLITSIIELIK